MSHREKSNEDVRKFTSMVAEKQGWFLHPDEEFLDNLIEGLKVNFNRYGYFSCPCRMASGEKEKDKDIICPCDYCRPDQEDYGHCYCGLYCTPEFYEKGEMPSAIPERRPEELDTY